jgi:hypothetical protein
METAMEIIRTAFGVAQNEHLADFAEAPQQKDFDAEAVFDVDDYRYFYSELLTDERIETEVNALVGLLELNSPKKSSISPVGLAGIQTAWQLWGTP